MEVPQVVIDWCSGRKLCSGCRFKGNQCVAPDGQHNFDDWVSGMIKLIEDEANAAQGH